jgi:hypothetical protein
MHPEFLKVPRFTNEAGVSRAEPRQRVVKPLLLAGKLIISAACFWLVLCRIDVNEIAHSLPTFDLRWAAFAVLLIMAQIPLLALRLRAIAHALAPGRLTSFAKCRDGYLHGIRAGCAKRRRRRDSRLDAVVIGGRD